MKTTFIGDIHAAATDLAVLLTAPNLAQQQLVFLGNYIDSAVSSASAPLRVLELVRQQVITKHAVALLGNHDDFWVQTAAGNELAYETWKLNHGQATWQQLGITATDLTTVQAQLNQPPLAKYTQFLKHLPLMWQNQHFLAVHAGINWQLTLQQQTRHDLTWIQDSYFFDDPANPTNWHRNQSKKIMITGHTPVQTLTTGHRHYLKMQADATDLPRYNIDAGSGSDLPASGILGLTLTATGAESALDFVTKGQLQHQGDEHGEQN